MEENEKEETEESPAANAGEGSESETDEKIERLNADTKRINEAIAENEHAKAREKLGGKSEAGMKTPEPVKETDEEYADKVMKGEANPLKEDGFIR